MSLTEKKRTGEFIETELPGNLSRSTVTLTVAAGTVLYPGHVLAKLSATGKYVEYDNAGSDGSESARAILYAEVDNSAGGAPADFTAVVIDFGAEVRKADLGWFSGASAGDKTAAYTDLAAYGIKARD